MKILDWINKFFRRNSIKKLDMPKDYDEKDWKKSLQYQPNINVVDENLEEEQIRDEQIKSMIFLVLFKDSYLLKDDIIKGIQGKYNEVVLKEEEIQSLISIYGVIRYEDLQGENNIRDFIDDDENNIIKLVDKLVEYAREEAQKYDSENVWEFVPNDVKLMDNLKNEIQNENTKENDDQDEIEVDREGE